MTTEFNTDPNRAYDYSEDHSARMPIRFTRDRPSDCGQADGHTFIVQLRQALGLFAGAMPISPEQAWEEAIAAVEVMRHQLAAAAEEFTTFPSPGVECPGPQGDPVLRGADLIAAERRRQIDDEGYDDEHDARHVPSQLVDAAMAYIYAYLDQRDSARMYWPWGIDHFKPRDQVSNLTRAGALIAAAIDRQHQRQRRFAVEYALEFPGAGTNFDGDPSNRDEVGGPR